MGTRIECMNTEFMVLAATTINNLNLCLSVFSFLFLSVLRDPSISLSRSVSLFHLLFLFLHLDKTPRFRLSTLACSYDS